MEYSNGKIKIDSLNSEEILSERIFNLIYGIKNENDRKDVLRKFEKRAKDLRIKVEFTRLYCSWCKTQDKEKAKKRAMSISKSIEECPEFVVVKFDKNGNYMSEKVSAPRLAEFFRKKNYYFIARDDNSSKTCIYIYDIELGVYRLCSTDRVMAWLKKEIAEYNKDLICFSTIREAFNDITMDVDKFVGFNDLNTEKYMINFKNGLLDLKTFEFKEHNPECKSTIQIPCNWNGVYEETPVFDQFISNLASGNEDIIRILLQFIGLTCSQLPGYKCKKALILVGEGNTGKTQFRNLIQNLVGLKNSASIELSTMESNQFSLAAAYGKRLIGSADLSFKSIRELQNFKKLTGGDAVSAEFKGYMPFNFIYSGTMLYCTNQLPNFGGDKGPWVYERMLIIRCNNVISPENRDPDILDKMLKESEGIMYKCIKALNMLIENNFAFKLPEECIYENQNYKIANNSVLLFLNQCMHKITPYDNDNVKCVRIYNIYKAWCAEGNYKCSDKTRFYDEIGRELGYDKSEEARIKKNSIYIFKDVVLNEDILIRFKYVK